MHHLLLQMETINVFINGCKDYGVSEKDMFVTLDLYEKTNPNMVSCGEYLKPRDLSNIYAILAGDFWNSGVRQTSTKEGA